MKTKVKIITLKDFIVFLPFFLFTVLLIGIYFFFASPLNHNNQGVNFLKKKDFESAIEAFSLAIDKTYFNPSPQLNLALSYDLYNKPLKALDIYSSISKKFKGLTQFYSYFNQGELKGRLGKTEEALENYQAALEFHREEKKIKENIEWLFSKNKKKKNENQKSEQSQKSQRKGEKGENQESNKTDRNSSQENQQEKKQENDSHNTKEEEQSRENQEEETQENKSTDDTEPSSENQKKDMEEFKEDTKKGEKNEESPLKEARRPGEKTLNEMERKAILNSIEKQESDIRARQFQNKSQQQRLKPGEKDW